jgi:hypothetical protein
MNLDHLEFPALRELQGEFRRLGAAEHLSVGGRGRRWGTRIVPLAALATLTVAAAAGATALVISEGDPIPPPPPGEVSADQQPKPGSERLDSDLAADPAGGLPWGVRVARNAQGLPCLAIGRVLDGKIGKVRGGVFHASPLNGSSHCAPAPDSGAKFTFDARPDSVTGDQRMIVYGQAAADVSAIEIASPSGIVRMHPGAMGAFIAVYAGMPAWLERTLVFTDGTRQPLGRGEFPDYRTR